MSDQADIGGPRILITRAEDVTGERWDDYADCVGRAGGDPAAVDLAGFAGVEGLPAFGGLLITAGVDVDPARYGEERSERVAEVDPARDAFEEALLSEATRRGLPVFAICRGVQLLNTARGGSLLQHLEEREPHRARRGEDGVTIESGCHEVSVAPGSLLERIAGARLLRVNSRHHQAVLPSGVAPGLRAVASAPDGVVEALEALDLAHPWLLGVQWHPERVEMTGDPELAAGSTRLFEAFVAACS
ncbi:MAG: gamma-glutamyl-gamma-aminobutyrate hydrolase family protein [Dehalococcoidia bacterium]|nr:gamma-glutamyl-gamma-aminobutyrate hydrolase family protein [Dehalococcoidia bacterium]